MTGAESTSTSTEEDSGFPLAAVSASTGGVAFCDTDIEKKVIAHGSITTISDNISAVT